MQNNKEEHFLYLVKDTKFKLMTVAQAAHLALMDDVEVFNVSESLDMEPELIEIED